jgi:hypothetical protein
MSAGGERLERARDPGARQSEHFIWYESGVDIHWTCFHETELISSNGDERL